MQFTRKRRAVLRAFYGLLGLLGFIMISLSMNDVISADAHVRHAGWIILAVGAVICTGGLSSLAYSLYKELTAKMVLSIRHARLDKVQLHSDQYEWHFRVEVAIKPPDGHLIVLQSDNIGARLDGAVPGFQFEIFNMGISPTGNRIVFDGAFAEMTVARQRVAWIEGKVKTTLNDEKITLPKTWNYSITLTDATGEWSETIHSGLMPSREGWEGLPSP